MERAEALNLIRENVKNKNLIKHMLATEAIMQKVAGYLKEDTEVWGLAGLVHDLDYDKTLETPEQHGLMGAQMLKDAGADPKIVQAVLAHGPSFTRERETPLDIALFAADPLSGLIVAAALIHPQKKLAALNSSFILKRFQEKWFAKGASREQIRACEKLDLTLEKFVELALKGMQEISRDLGL